MWLSSLFEPDAVHLCEAGLDVKHAARQYVDEEQVRLCSESLTCDREQGFNLLSDGFLLGKVGMTVVGRHAVKPSSTMPAAQKQFAVNCWYSAFILFLNKGYNRAL